MPELFIPGRYYYRLLNGRVIVCHQRFHGALTIPRFASSQWCIMKVFRVQGEYLRPAA